MSFEAVIGLEVHAQLMTKSKLFCPCPNVFEAPPNANTCPVCAGHPGSLPVLNARAVELAVKAGLVLGCRIKSKSVFARKNYFYPDLPKGYQISQYDQPLCEGGGLDIDVPEEPGRPAHSRHVGLIRIHMEEDAGKSVHMPGYSLVNLNRAATPLIEIVSKPEIASPTEAGAYLRKLRAVLMYLGVCDGNMQEGSLRCDANVSIRPSGRPIGNQKLGTRTEIKNVNSFRFLEKAIEYEINRQIQVVRSGGAVVQETRLYDSARNVTQPMRGKEEAHDYRYFPDPDLVPIIVTDAMLEAARRAMPELPDQKKERFTRELGLSGYEASVITASKELAAFFEETTAHCGEPKMVANWVMGEMLRLLKQEEKELDELTMRPANLAGLIRMIQAGRLSTTTAKTVFEEIYKTGREAESIVEEKGLVQISDPSAILASIEAVIAESPSQTAEYRAGKEKVLGYFVGQVMKRMGGKANPGVVNELLKKTLASDRRPKSGDR